jgi:phosphate transport system permease protein
MSRALTRSVSDMAFKVLCFVVTAIALTALGAILWSLISQGLPGMKLDIFTMSTPAPGSRGGLLNAILGSIFMCGMAMVVAAMVGVLAGTWLSEFAGESRYGHVVRFLNDILLSAPSILIGLFIYGILVAPLGGFSGFAGAAALAMIAIPVIIRSTEDVLRLQPIHLREASSALGAPRWRTVLSVLWRSAGAGMLTGGLLAFARISGETAPLMFTAMGNQFLNLDPSHPTASLPVMMYNFALSPADDWRQLAWNGALLVVVAVLTVSLIARKLIREPNRS